MRAQAFPRVVFFLMFIVAIATVSYAARSSSTQPGDAQLGEHPAAPPPFGVISHQHHPTNSLVGSESPDSIPTGVAAGLLRRTLSSARRRDAQHSDEYRGFGAPRRVTIRGYKGHAMEPFFTRDRRYLMFNNLNDPKENTNLHYAERRDDLTFEYKGEIKGVNSVALEGVPSMDEDGMLYFVSPRSYDKTFSTLYRGRFKDGAVDGVELVRGVSREQPGIVNFDVEISADGKTLYTVDGEFTKEGPNPKAADIVIAMRDGTGFTRDPKSSAILELVNTEALEYAADISADGLELFFTRVSVPPTAPPAIFRSVRKSQDEPFEKPQKVAGPTGFVEASTLSRDGRTMYYHTSENGRHVIYCLTR